MHRMHRVFSVCVCVCVCVLQFRRILTLFFCDMSHGKMERECWNRLGIFREKIRFKSVICQPHRDRGQPTTRETAKHFELNKLDKGTFNNLPVHM